METISKIKKQGKNIKKTINRMIKVITILILVAGMVVFDLPSLTLFEVLGSVSLVGLALTITTWIK